MDRVMLPSLSVWYWTYGGQSHAAVSTDQPGTGHMVDGVNEGHATVSIDQSGIGI